MKTRTKIVCSVCTLVAFAFVLPTHAQDDPPAQTLFTNVQIFDGVSEERKAGNVLVEGNMITRGCLPNQLAPRAPQ